MNRWHLADVCYGVVQWECTQTFSVREGFHVCKISTNISPSFNAEWKSRNIGGLKKMSMKLKVWWLRMILDHFRRSPAEWLISGHKSTKHKPDIERTPLLQSSLGIHQECGNIVEVLLAVMPLEFLSVTVVCFCVAYHAWWALSFAPLATTWQMSWKHFLKQEITYQYHYSRSSMNVVDKCFSVLAVTLATSFDGDRALHVYPRGMFLTFHYTTQFLSFSLPPKITFISNTRFVRNNKTSCYIAYTQKTGFLSPW